MPNSFFLVITGPTSSGKTAFAESIASRRFCEIVNADVGQLYAPFSIGTAKPDFNKKEENVAVAYHGFDVLKTPDSYTIFDYYKLATQSIFQAQERGNLAIVVGGSLFYIKSLFFPPKDISTIILDDRLQDSIDVSLDTESLWNILDSVDTKRAKAIHPHDRYRIITALTIWKKTKIQPSQLESVYNKKVKALVVAIIPNRDEMYERINQRAMLMLENGWIEEVVPFINTPWENFFKYKGLLGYEEICLWIRGGSKKNEYKNLVDRIKQDSRNYASRQVIFWKKLKREIEQSRISEDFVKIEIIDKNNSSNTDNIIQIVDKMNNK